jgi:O-antigen chain-terminating methyltransferase
MRPKRGAETECKMNEMHGSAFELDQEMKRIREKIVRRKRVSGQEVETVREPAPATVSTPDRGDDEASPERIVLPRLSESEGRIERKDAYRLEDFLCFHDVDFVSNAYRGILRREPDDSGMGQYLTELRAGRIAKTEIIGRLRFSAEGRAARVPVRGLAMPFALRTACRIPIAGPILGMLQYLIRLPILVRNHERLEAVLFHRELEMKRQVNAIEMRIEEWAIASGNATNARIERLRREFDGDAERLRGEMLREKMLVELGLAEFEQQIAENGNGVKAGIEQLRRESKAGIEQLRREFDDDAERLRSGLLQELANIAPMEHADVLLAKDDRLLDPMYVSFEDRFRGARDDIKRRVEIYLPDVRQAGAGTAEAPVLDIGCGRGEWLELLKENGLTAIGIDLNHVMATECRTRGLEVLEMDALQYLRRLTRGSIGAVTGIHVVEHLPIRRLVALIDETLRVLKRSGVAIFETPNPENLIVGACNFYYDFTHRTPLPPEPFAFLLQSRGFARVEIRRMHPNAEGMAMEAAETPLDHRLRELMFGDQDYAVIAHNR